ncbi:Crp/Fnr family transcriptional regulator [Maribacter litoralis]|uniref:Crp/Fnr family transcriptional regulator n=1 Tax=Maribacter litoralis TaxID=2059726 RepID=UPI003F5CCC6D
MQLCIITGFKNAKKGEILYFSDSDVPRIFLLKKGNIKIVQVDDHGNESIKEILRKGDLFGELSLEKEARSVNEYAKAISDEITICSFFLEDFERLIEKNPKLALSYTKFIGFKMKRLKNSYTNLIFKDARTRLSQFLKDWSEKDGVFDGNKVTIENYLTQTDISQIICTTRQTATQLLNELKENGLIEYTRKEIIISDITKI